MESEVKTAKQHKKVEGVDKLVPHELDHAFVLYLATSKHATGKLVMTSDLLRNLALL